MSNIQRIYVRHFQRRNVSFIKRRDAPDAIILVTFGDKKRKSYFEHALVYTSFVRISAFDSFIKRIMIYVKI